MPPYYLKCAACTTANNFLPQIVCKDGLSLSAAYSLLTVQSFQAHSMTFCKAVFKQKLPLTVVFRLVRAQNLAELSFSFLHRYFLNAPPALPVC